MTWRVVLIEEHTLPQFVLQFSEQFDVVNIYANQLKLFHMDIKTLPRERTILNFHYNG
jgi:hypothetical protein